MKEKNDIEYRHVFTFLFLIVDHIKQAIFWRTKNICPITVFDFLKLTRCLKKDFICLCGKIFQTYKRVFLVD